MKLKLVKQPKRIEPEWKMCVACKAFLAECFVPVGEASAQMCWLCAHAVADHDCAPHAAATHECECAPWQIYPNRAAPLVEPPPPPELSPREIERSKLIDGPVERLVKWVEEAHKQMSSGQHAALKKRLGS